jgi:3-deoxy-D-manno-octulosonate 8-phosphate phosphatase (KDO 8-P phosphatase)
MEKVFFERLTQIRGFVFSFDGVFTSNKLLLLNNGEKLREINNIDANAISIAIQKRYKIAVILDEASEGITMWLNYVGVKDIFRQNDLKQASYESFAIENGLNLTETVFAGSDVVDYSALKLAGISVCPADAVPEIKGISNYICESKGGEGCVREIVSLVMKANRQWNWS